MAQVLFVDDDEKLCRTVTRILLRDSHSVVTASSVAEAERALDAGTFQVVFLDLIMPERGGANLLPRLEALAPPPLVAVISAHSDAVHELELAGWRGMVLPKPFSPDVICQVVEQAQAKHHAVAEHTEAANDDGLVADFAARFGLSQREAEVLEGLYADKAIKEIAAKLGIKASTARTYVRRIGHKTGCQSAREVMAAVARFAVRRGRR